MKFHSYIPIKLNGLVEMIWEQEMETACRYSILPSGKVEFIVPIYKDVKVSGCLISENENPIKNYGSFLSGLHTKPLHMTLQRFHTFGIQMKPIAVMAIFGMPLSEIKNYFSPGEAVLSTFREIETEVNDQKSFLSRAKWVEAFFLKKIKETADLHLAMQLEKSLYTYVTKNPARRKSISDLVGYSRTHTYRLFNTWFGTSSHSYLQLLQFIRSVHSLHHNTDLNLTQTGYLSGYYDQAHFIRSFSEFADLTPGAYRKAFTPVPGQIIQPLGA